MMIHGIKISDTTHGYVSVTLSNILESIEGDNLYWAILSLYATGDLGEGKSLVEFESTLSQSPCGYQLTWEELKGMAQRFDQVIDTVIIGCENVDGIARYESEEEMIHSCELMIEMFDSSYWRVFSHDEQVIAKLADRFERTERLSK